MAECCFYTAEVVGSSPTGTTLFFVYFLREVEDEHRRHGNQLRDLSTG